MTRRSGLQALDDTVPDFVFLDIGMPGIDGYETCSSDPAAPTVEKSDADHCRDGLGQPQDKTRGLDAGFDAHLTKPVDLEALARILGPAVRPARSDELPELAMEARPGDV